MPNSKDRVLLVGLALGIFALFSLLIYQFYKIQIIEGEKWSSIAKRQHFFLVTEPFLRGRFVSNTSIKKAQPGHPEYFVFDIQKFHLYIDPSSIPEEHRKEIASNLKSHIDFSQQEADKLPLEFAKNSRSRKLAMWLESEVKEKIQEWWGHYARKNKIPSNALYFVSDYQRSYPFGKMLGQILHTVQNNKDEATKQALPTGGLELYFNSYLKGKLGKRLLKRSPRHSFETGTVIEAPENGADIHLSINHVLQAIAEEEIEKGVKKCKAKGGRAIMMDPKTGEILAIAQYPFFYPANYSEYFNDPEKGDYTLVKSLTDAYEPGSVMKPLTLAIALKANKVLKERGEAPLFKPEEKVATSVGKFPGRKKELKDLSHHKFLNMNMALQKSSNIYMAKLAQKIVERLGAAWYRNELSESFGFGKRTGVELPSESPGLLPTPGKVHPNGQLEWSASTPYSLAMGHNIMVNSIQLCTAYCSLANGGYRVNPTFIRKIVKNDEVLVDNTGPKPARQVLDPEIVKEVVKAMKYVTKRGGSGTKAELWGYTEAGKTGTANEIENGTYSQTKYTSSFIGFTPLKDPAFVLLIVMNQPEYRYIPGVGHNHRAGTAAAPVFREIARRSLDYLGIAPDDPHGYPSNDPRYDPLKADWIPEVKQLQELYEKWNN